MADNGEYNGGCQYSQDRKVEVWMVYQPGQSVKGYEILERIGAGGFGAVYRAYQTTLGREVALKVILPGHANHPEFIRRFEIEAQLVARLEHLHVVPLYDYWRDPDGAYLVMRWLRGGSLKDALEAGPLALNEAARALDQIAAGLASAHAAGVIHQDLKPSNILLDEEGNAYLADFGIAKYLGEMPDQSGSHESFAGSPDYLSPEQARGQPVTAQTDIYGLGVTLYELLTGGHPFPGLTGVERLFKHINDPLPRIESLDPLVQEEVNNVIQRATAKDPKLRFGDVLEMAAAFRRAARVGEEGRWALVESLTLREQEILQLIMQGKSNREIAEALFIELSTVKWYIRQIYPKLGAHNRRQAILRARELDLIVPEDEEQVVVEGRARVSLMMPAPTNPYKGLRPFEAADSRDFFGRDLLVRRLLGRLAGADGAANGRPARAREGAQARVGMAERFLAIVGPSGSGKSSLVRAGLIPALGRGEVAGSERWFVVQMAPGARPLDELEVGLIRIATNQPGNLRAQLERDPDGLLRAAELLLPRDGSELVLVIDQFEELFTVTGDEAVRRHFLEMLSRAVTDAHSRIRLIITLRADYYDRPLHYPQFGDLVRSHMETILPLSAEALEQAITLPAAQAGVSCEPGLAATIIDDVLYQPGGLPLLQYALTELFEQRSGRMLTREAYQAIGGATGALARRAEELFREQDEAGQAGVRQLFLRLVAIDEEKNGLLDTRRRVLRSELVDVSPDEELMDDIIDSYAAYRLLTLDHHPASRRPTVELAHEALLREWDRLRLWLEESRGDLLQQRRLQLLAGEWLDGGQDAGLLLSQTRLDQFAAWQADSDLVLAQDERAFLDASLAAREDRRAKEEARRQRELETARRLAEAERQRAETQAETARRLRRQAGYLSAALAIVAILAVVALAAGRRSALNATRAETNASIASTHEAQAAREAAAASTAEAMANEQRLIAEAERDSAEAAARAAASAQATAEAEAVQRAAAQVAAIQERETAEAQARLAAARELSLAALSNLAVDPELSILLAQQAVNRTYMADGRVLPEAMAALHQSLMGLRQERVLESTTPATCQLNIWCSDVVYSGGTGLLAGSGPENTAVVWQADGGEQRFILEGHAAPVVAVAFAAAGDMVATASADDTAMLWELPLESGPAVLTEAAAVLRGHTADVTGVAFSPDGTMAATASRDNSIKIWDVQTGEEIRTLNGHEESVRDVVFSPEGTALFSASSDATARIWEVASGEERETLAGHSDRLTDLALSPDGSRVATASWDGTIKVWSTASGTELLSLRGDPARVYAVAFSPDGRQLAGGGTGAVISVWDAETGDELLVLAGHKGLIHNLAFAPDGTRLASGAGDGTIRIWDVSRAGNREWLALDGHNWVMFGVDFSPDGTQVATASWDGAVKLWDAETGAELTTLVADEWRKFSVAFSPDGRYVAASALNDTATLWETASGALRATFSGHQGPILDVAWSPDGGRLVTVGEGSESPGLIAVWDTASGALERSWVGHDSSIERVAISPDGRLLATGSTDGTARVWRFASGELMATLVDHEAAVNAVNFSHDGGLLGTAGADNTARIWAVAGDTITPVVTLHGHSSTVWDIVFSPDDSLAVTIGFDEAVKLWDVAAGIEVLTLPGASNNGREVAFSPDGVYLAVTTSSGLVRIYVVPVERLLDVARARLSRALTDDECRQYLHTEYCSP